MSFKVPFQIKLSTKGEFLNSSTDVSSSPFLKTGDALLLGSSSSNTNTTANGMQGHWRSGAPSQRVVVCCDFSVPKTTTFTDHDTGETSEVTKYQPRNVDVQRVTVTAPCCTHIELRGKSGIDGKEVVLCPKQEVRSMFEHKRFMHQLASRERRGGGELSSSTTAAKSATVTTTATAAVAPAVVSLDARRTLGGAVTEVYVYLLNMWEPLDRISFLHDGGIEVKGAYCKDPTSCALKPPATPTSAAVGFPSSTATPPTFIPVVVPTAPVVAPKPKKTPPLMVVPTTVGGGGTSGGSAELVGKMTGKKREFPEIGTGIGGEEVAQPLARDNYMMSTDEMFPVTFGSDGAPAAEDEDDFRVFASSSPLVAAAAAIPPPSLAAAHRSPPNVVAKVALLPPSLPPGVPSSGTALKGCVIVLSGYQNPARSEIRDKAISMGAVVQNDWTARATHLICVSPSTPKYVEATKAGNGLIVSKDWVLDSWSRKTRQDETYFIVGSGGLGGGGAPAAKKHKGEVL